MDIKQVLQSRSNRSTRLARPFKNFFEVFEQCAAAGDLILAGTLDSKVAMLLERSAVITTVTAIEVYYRDILAVVFKYCAPSFFEPHLKQLHPEKFDVADLIEVYRHNVHPLEVVVASQSFQNVERIDKVFSKFLQRGSLWENVFQLQVRLKDKPESENTWARDELLALKRTFDLRHELVHDPARRSFFNAQVLDDLWQSAHVIFGSDLVLAQVLTANRDPDFDAGPDD